MLKIRNLTAGTGEIEIIKGLNLTVNPGEIHAIMGPNGSGKSTLAKLIAGHCDYRIFSGTISYTPVNKEPLNLKDMEPHVRAQEGIFVGFQYPVEIPGVTNATFLRESYNSIASYQGRDTLDPYDFNELVRSKLADLEIDASFINRPVNEGFSGGEKKKNEVLQMSVLSPALIILDETDSGLDIDALKTVAKGIKQIRDKRKAIVLITHYQRLLNHIEPDYVHVFINGTVIKSGGKELALELEESGYDQFL